MNHGTMSLILSILLVCSTASFAQPPVDVPGTTLDGSFTIRLVESDGQEWGLDINRDYTWQFFSMALNSFGSGSEFLDTTVSRIVLVPVGGGTIGGPIFEVSDWIDQIVLKDTVIDDFEDGDHSDWHVNIALNGSYLGTSSDSLTPDGSTHCMRIIHGNSWFGTFAGYMEKDLQAMALAPSDTLSFWLRGVGYTLSGVDDPAGEHPQVFTLFQNYPNPFNPSTTIRFRTAAYGFVTLRVFDVLGREVASLVNEMKQPGDYSVRFDAGTLASGIYFYKLTADRNDAVKKLVVME
jgi:hypothetical protein